MDFNDDDIIILVYQVESSLTIKHCNDLSRMILVGGLEHLVYFVPSYKGNVMIPTDFHFIIFQRGRYTTNQILRSLTIKMMRGRYTTNQILRSLTINIPFSWDVILPIDELICFKMVKTTNQKTILMMIYDDLWIIN